MQLPQDLGGPCLNTVSVKGVKATIITIFHSYSCGACACSNNWKKVLKK